MDIHYLETVLHGVHPLTIEQSLFENIYITDRQSKSSFNKVFLFNYVPKNVRQHLMRASVGLVRVMRVVRVVRVVRR